MTFCSRIITRSRKCWNCPNICPVTADLEKDIQLREAVVQFNIKVKALSCTKDNTGNPDLVYDTGRTDNSNHKIKQVKETKDKFVETLNHRLKDINIRPTDPKERSKTFISGAFIVYAFEPSVLK